MRRPRVPILSVGGRIQMSLSPVVGCLLAGSPGGGRGRSGGQFVSPFFLLLVPAARARAACKVHEPHPPGGAARGPPPERMSTMPPRTGDWGCLGREGGPHHQGDPVRLPAPVVPGGVGVAFPRSYGSGKMSARPAWLPGPCFKRTPRVRIPPLGATATSRGHARRRGGASLETPSRGLPLWAGGGQDFRDERVVNALHAP